jgi:hypothetical protein
MFWKKRVRFPIQFLSQQTVFEENLLVLEKMTEISENIIDNCGFKSSKTQQFYSDSSKSASATVIVIDIIIDLYNLLSSPLSTSSVDPYRMS